MQNQPFVCPLVRGIFFSAGVFLSLGLLLQLNALLLLGMFLSAGVFVILSRNMRLRVGIFLSVGLFFYLGIFTPTRLATWALWVDSYNGVRQWATWEGAFHSSVAIAAGSWGLVIGAGLAQVLARMFGGIFDVVTG